MALRRILRKRCPKDGSWFRTEVHLASVLRAVSDEDIPQSIHGYWTAVEMRLAPHIGQATPRNPSAIYYHAEIRFGEGERLKVVDHVSPYVANLHRDTFLDGYDSDEDWHYHPISADWLYGRAPGEDTSVYECLACGKSLYEDKTGRRTDRSAVRVDGDLVCRDCDVNGIVYDDDAAAQIERCRKLADFIGGDCRAKFEQKIEFLSRGTCFDNLCQTRVYRDGDWSFYWSDTVRRRDGTSARGMCGGLILHGPHPSLGEDGAYLFSRWDYDLKAERRATPEEIARSEWSIHT